MSQPDPAPAVPQPDPELSAAGESFSQSMRGLGNLVERIMPWLLEFGVWIFAGLIAFILIILASLITVRPVDRAITFSTAAFALALPLNVAGLVLLKLVQDMQRIGFADEFAHAFREAGLPVEAYLPAPADIASRQTRRTQITLLYALNILVLSGLLTVTGVVAALWHMAWWIGVAFIVMLVVSLGIVVAALLTIRPPDSPEAKERQRRYWQEQVRLARARTQGNAPQP